MRWITALPPVALCALLAAAGCDRAAAPKPIPDAVLDFAPWEKAFAASEMDSWREGTVEKFGEPDPDGRPSRIPVPGARVELFAATPEGHQPLTPVAESVSDERGRFRVGPGPLSAWVVQVSKPGYATSTIGGGVKVPGTFNRTDVAKLDIPLFREHEAVCKVEDMAGKPLAGVRISAVAIGYRQELVTGEDGRAVLRCPAMGVMLHVIDPRYDLVYEVMEVSGKGPAAEKTLRTRAAEPLRGWVESTDGPPVANAVVMSIEDPSLRTRTDAEGRFELRIPRHHGVVAFADGFGWRQSATPRAGDLQFRLKPVAGVTGVVVDAQGRPVEGARLRAVITGGPGRYQWAHGPLTGPDGTFDYSWLPRPPRGVTTPARIIAVKRGLGESLIVGPKNLPGGEPEHVRLALMGVRDVSGTVRRGGEPIPGARIEAKWGHWDGISSPEAEALSMPESFATWSDSEGKWRLRAVPNGVHAKIRCEYAKVGRERMLVAEPREAETIDFEIEPTLSISGRCTDAAGNPPEGPVIVTATLVDAPGVDHERTSPMKADATFQIDDLPPGQYQLRADGNAYDLAGGHLRPAGSTDALLKLERSATLTVRFVFDDGVIPEVPLVVQLLPIPGGSQQYRDEIQPGRAGAGWERSGIYPGPKRLLVEGDVWRGGIERIELGDGERKEIELPVHRTLRVTGKLVGADGKPIARELVVLAPVPPTKGSTQTATSAADGSLDLTGLSVGRWRASATLKDRPPLVMDFDVVGGANPPLELRIPPHGSLRVVVARELLPKEGGAVIVLPINAWADGLTSTASRFRTNAEGQLVIVGLRAGPVRVEVRGAGSPVQRDVEIAPGKETELEVR